MQLIDLVEMVKMQQIEIDRLKNIVNELASAWNAEIDDYANPVIYK